MVRGEFMRGKGQSTGWAGAAGDQSTGLSSFPPLCHLQTDLRFSPAVESHLSAQTLLWQT